jgi:hypothetical protein
MATRKTEYDFRDGIEGSKLVYRNDETCNCRDCWSYIGYLLATWIWACGWFALFLKSWLLDRKAAFIAYVVIWGVFLAILIFGFFLPNLLAHYKKKKERREFKAKLKAEEEARLNEAIGKAVSESPNKKARQDDSPVKPKEEVKAAIVDPKEIELQNKQEEKQDPKPEGDQ